MGGKSRLAKSISRAILDNTSSRSLYLEPFVGGGSVLAEMAPEFTQSLAGDIQPDLILMWNALLFDRWEPPVAVTEDEHRALKVAEPSALRGFVGFGTSWGGRFFEGYARSGKQDYAKTSASALLKKRGKILAGTWPLRMSNRPYQEWLPASGQVVYCDPPYAGTKKYSNVQDFDNAKFWATMDEWVCYGADVFVSEYTAPAHWDSVWEQGRKVTMDRLKNDDIAVTEHLFHRAPYSSRLEQAA